MTTKQRFPLEVALPIAQGLAALLSPHCERIEIAGSIRRQRSDVGDMELLLIPTVTFDDALEALIWKGVLAKRPNAKGAYTFGRLNKLMVDVASGIPLDIFSTDARNWGMSLFVRTGPAEWNIKAMTQFRRLGLIGHAYGGISRGEEEIECPEEADVFKWLQWSYVEPKERNA